MIKMNPRIYLLLFLLILLLLTTLFISKLYFDQLFFNQKIQEVHVVLRDNKPTKKIVYSREDGKTGVDILFANDNLNKLTATKISTLIVPYDPIIQTVIFYNRKYIVIPYGIGEGLVEYLIFTEEGKIITTSLLADNSFLLTDTQYTLLNPYVSEVGSLTLTSDESKQLAIFDITTGKFKKYEKLKL